VRRITALANDLALALAAPTIRIEAPVPGKAMLGIEVPNQTTTVVAMRSVIESPPFQKLTAKTKLPIALGKSVEGESAVFDLAKAPHLLIAGATGSGKSVCINSIITCLLMHCDPTDVRLLMVDPKRVELAAFSGIPHLLSPIIVENDQVVAALRWVTKEMDERYKRFAEAAARNIDAYNQKPPDGRKLPYLVVVIDELADVMMASPFEVERTLVRLAQLARAAGIHVIIATQRPSVDVVTGLIKANFPTRIAFAVTSQVDSRTILDMAGAEKLLGRGDMLYMATDAAKPRRLQGVYLSDAEIDRVVRFWREQKAEGLDVKQVTHEIEELADPEESPGGGRKVDALYEQAKAIAEAKGSISTSYLQRRLSIGYNRAARLVEQLEEEGLISPSDDGKTREFRPSGMSAASPPTSPATAKPDSNEDDDSLPF
jgi:S-DNA-T family DNA segregation ATPase FtsK/SpoIIIE